MTQPAQSTYAYAQVWFKELRKNKPVEKFYEDSKITKLSFFLEYILCLVYFTNMKFLNYIVF